MHRPYMYICVYTDTFILGYHGKYCLLQTLEQFEHDGCDNCEDFLPMKQSRDTVMEATSSSFDGLDICARFVSVAAIHIHCQFTILDRLFIQYSSCIVHQNTIETHAILMHNK